jgi:tRNA pseudouridine55 synthase
MDLVINLNKPKGITSHEAVLRVKKILRAKKAGHTGTLDPSATGVLLVCTNNATRFASYFSDLNKKYSAVLKLGETTDTQDADGKIIEKNTDIEVDESRLKDTLQSFTGEILQSPPMYSALKYKGKPLYKYARKSIDIPRKPRAVFIHQIGLQDINLPFIRFQVVCSKGTYIRTLCDDIGKKLGTGAHLFELQRTAIESFCIDESVGIEELRDMTVSPQGQERPRHSGIYSTDSALYWMPEMTTEESDIKTVTNGNPLKIKNRYHLPEEAKSSQGIKIKSPGGELLAVGRFSRDKNEVKMDVVIAR